jgi:hypothetical protein
MRKFSELSEHPCRHRPRADAEESCTPAAQLRQQNKLLSRQAAALLKLNGGKHRRQGSQSQQVQRRGSGRERVVPGQFIEMSRTRKVSMPVFWA